MSNVVWKFMSKYSAMHLTHNSLVNSVGLCHPCHFIKVIIFMEHCYILTLVFHWRHKQQKVLEPLAWLKISPWQSMASAEKEPKEKDGIMGIYRFVWNVGMHQFLEIIKWFFLFSVYAMFLGVYLECYQLNPWNKSLIFRKSHYTLVYGRRSPREQRGSLSVEERLISVEDMNRVDGDDCFSWTYPLFLNF